MKYLYFSSANLFEIQRALVLNPVSHVFINTRSFDIFRRLPNPCKINNRSVYLIEALTFCDDISVVHSVIDNIVDIKYCEETRKTKPFLYPNAVLGQIGQKIYNLFPHLGEEIATGDFRKVGSLDNRGANMVADAIIEGLSTLPPGVIAFAGWYMSGGDALIIKRRVEEVYHNASIQFRCIMMNRLFTELYIIL